VNDKLLAIYLNDHLAGSAGALELVGRALASNRGTEFEGFLERFRREIEYDRTALEELMDRFEIGEDRLKLGAAWAAEKVGRLKLNGALRGYSPLSRVVELEALTIAVNGKLAMWRALAELSEDPVLADFDIERFADRAVVQLRDLERHRGAAARLAFA
jgi:hypothetical protein